MAEFDPKVGQEIVIRGTGYIFPQHPGAGRLKTAFAATGTKGTVYKLEVPGNKNGTTNTAHALKVFVPKYRTKRLAEETNTLINYASIDGMEVCKRLCITRDLDEALIKQYPDLEYAMLMPWVEGRTWFDFVLKKENLDRPSSLKMALQTVQVFEGLEKRQIAHTDIAGGNVIFNSKSQSLCLIDVEDIYAPNRIPPNEPSRGQDGYSHPKHNTGKGNQWNPYGDRFAGAILLSEVLAWGNPVLRQMADEETFFNQSELQDIKSDRYKKMREYLSSQKPEFADFFESAWRSDRLEDCPGLSQWKPGLEQLLKATPPVTNNPFIKQQSGSYTSWSGWPSPGNTPMPKASANPTTPKTPTSPNPFTRSGDQPGSVANATGQNTSQNPFVKSAAAPASSAQPSTPTPVSPAPKPKTTPRAKKSSFNWAAFIITTILVFAIVLVCLYSFHLIR